MICQGIPGTTIRARLGMLNLRVHNATECFVRLSNFYLKLNVVCPLLLVLGLNKDDYSAHSLRSGFMTEAINQGISLQEAMQLSGHKDVHVAHGYYRETELESNRAVTLIENN